MSGSILCLHQLHCDWQLFLTVYVALVLPQRTAACGLSKQSCTTVGQYTAAISRTLALLCPHITHRSSPSKWLPSSSTAATTAAGASAATGLHVYPTAASSTTTATAAAACSSSQARTSPRSTQATSLGQPIGKLVAAGAEWGISCSCKFQC